MESIAPRMEPHLVMDEALCNLHRRATPSWRLNFLTVGLPNYLVPEEAVETGVVILPPTQRQVNLTFRCPNFMDLYNDRMLVDLWLVEGDAPNQTLTRVTPFNPTIVGQPPAIASDVRMRMFDAGTQQELQADMLPWQYFASDGRTPFRFQVPFIMRGSRTYSFAVQNFSTTQTFAISVTLVGRKRRVEGSTYGWSSDDKKLMRFWIKRERELGNLGCGYLTGDHASNLRGAGMAKVLPFPQQPVALAAGTLNVQSETNVEVTGNRRYVYMARQWNGRQELNDGQATTWIPGATLPIFGRVFDQNAQYWISNGFVPFRHLFGDGELPSRFPVDWALGKNANIQFVLRNAGVAANVMVDMEGWYRATGALEEAEVC